MPDTILFSLGGLFPNLKPDASNLADCLEIALKNPLPRKTVGTGDADQFRSPSVQRLASQEIYALLKLESGKDPAP